MSTKIDSVNSEEKIDNFSNRKSSGKDGFYVKKKLVYILAIVIPLLFVGSILATYFGKPENTTQNIIKTTKSNQINNDGKIIVYIGSYTHRPEGNWLQGNASTKSIRAYELNKIDGSLKLIAEYGPDYAGKNSIYMTTTQNGNYLYAVNSLIGQNEESNIISFKIDKNNNGQLIRINSVIGTGGQNAVHISLDENENFIYISHYDNGGALSVYRRNKTDGSIGQRVFLGSFPNSGGNLHSCYSIKNKYVYAPDLGRNKILNYVSDPETGSCLPNSYQLDGFVTKSGPRHMAFHSNGLYAYILHEFSNDISILSINTTTGSLDLIEDKISTLAPGVVAPSGQSAGAIRITDDQQFLYVSNRVVINSITAYKILSNGNKLSFIGTYETLGKVPRDFYILKEYLIVSNQNSASVVTFIINLNGSLTKLNGPTSVEMPLAVVAIEI